MVVPYIEVTTDNSGDRGSAKEQCTSHQFDDDSNSEKGISSNLQHRNSATSYKKSHHS